MANYAASTDVPVERSESEIKRMLMKYGATDYGSTWNQRQSVICFSAQGRTIRFILPHPDPAAFAETPGRGLKRKQTQVEQQVEQETRRRWRWSSRRSSRRWSPVSPRSSPSSWRTSSFPTARPSVSGSVLSWQTPMPPRQCRRFWGTSMARKSPPVRVIPFSKVHADGWLMEINRCFCHPRNTALTVMHDSAGFLDAILKYARPSYRGDRRALAVIDQWRRDLRRGFLVMLVRHPKGIEFGRPKGKKQTRERREKVAKMTAAIRRPIECAKKVTGQSRPSRRPARA